MLTNGKIFLSFEFDHDAHRARTVQAVLSAHGGTIDLEQAKARNDSEVKKWVDAGIAEASVTVVLVGSHTRQSKWVEYEIRRSKAVGNGLLGIDVSKIPDRFGRTSECPCRFPVGYPFYDWIADDGERNVPVWIALAAEKAGVVSAGLVEAGLTR